MIKFIRLLILVLALSPAPARPSEFTPTNWSEGMHLLAGGGINSSLIHTDKVREEIGLGTNFQTALGYYFNEKYAIEWNAAVNFNSFGGFLIWDTAFTIGLRFQFPEWAKIEQRLGEPYGRIFFGRAPTVVYFNGQAPPGIEPGVERVQIDGPIWGVALGSFYHSTSGRIWYSEIVATHHDLTNETGIRMNGEVPVQMYNRSTLDHPIIYSIYVTVGVMAF